VDFEQLIDRLCLPESYPHPVEVITTIETHISVVFLTGEYAYKLKKPVDFGFLDFTSLASRKHFCEQELRLNRRTAPQLYLQVVPIYLGDRQTVTFNPDCAAQQPANALDYLVKMRQFEPSWVLGRYLQEHNLSSHQQWQLAEQIARLHLNAQTVPEASLLGKPETVLQPMLDNFPTLFDNCQSQYKSHLQKLLDWTWSQYSALKPQLIERRRNGYVRECHGDLHLDNITLMDDCPTLFDGIEFNEAFRWIDVISDLAFLLIDLEFRQKTTLKRRILNHYLALTADYEAFHLLNFYSVYRSLVRAKISALRVGQLDPKTLACQHYRKITLEYIEQAQNLAFSQPACQLILMQGVSGSGKSHCAWELLQLVEGIVISSDVERKRLYGISAHTRVTAAEKARLYSAEMNQKTYQTLLELSERLLKQGQTVIVDATFLQAAHRSPFWKLAQQLRVQAGLIYIQSDPVTATQAIQQRQQRNDNPSDADETVMREQLKRIEPPLPHERALILNAEVLRRHFPLNRLQTFLTLPIT
jgi:hypothetical protein